VIEKSILRAEQQIRLAVAVQIGDSDLSPTVPKAQVPCPDPFHDKKTDGRTHRLINQ
jgi:hypothetical protein